MLSWWLGKPADGNRVQDGNHELEPPETPAPVFAARALKSAIFGAPALTDDETIYESDEETRETGPADTMKGQHRNTSPTRPPGILLTPGTGTTRRKTVSFGNEVVDKHEGKQGQEKPTGKSGLPDDFPGKYPSPWVSKSESSKTSARKTSLTKQLEDAREEKGSVTTTSVKRTSLDSKRPFIDGPSTEKKDKGNGRGSAVSTSSRPRSSQDPPQEIVNKSSDADMTVDLNEPQSQSGRYWKSEYEQYHEQAIEEMRKLATYKVLAKDFAMMKDAEAIKLASKLKEEQKKVLAMEDKISQLSARIASSGLEGNDDESPELIKELARQTALAVQYKSRVEEFRKAMEGKETNVGNLGASHNAQHFASPRTEQTLLDTHNELKKARDQLKEMVTLKDEARKLREALADAEKSKLKLLEENTKLGQQLLHADLRLEREAEKSERKRRSLEEHRQKKDEMYQNLQKDYDKLKELAKSQRRESESLLKQRHNQVIELRKEIASLKSADPIIDNLRKQLQRKTEEHAEVVAGYEKQIEELRESKDRLKERRERDRRDMPPPPSNLPSSVSTGEATHTRESHIPVLSQSITRPSKTLPSSKQLRSDTPNTPQHRSSQSALSEIINNATVDAIPPRWSGPVQHTPVQMTPLVNSFSHMSMDSPEMQLPSPEPSLPLMSGRAIHERNCQASPRPSMFNIPSSPPKPAIVRPRPSGNLTRQKSSNDLGDRRHADLASSRLSSTESSRVRAAIPPERAAAAKARLEQKQAEKKRLQALGLGKENS